MWNDVKMPVPLWAAPRHRARHRAVRRATTVATEEQDRDLTGRKARDRIVGGVRQRRSVADGQTRERCDSPAAAPPYSTLMCTGEVQVFATNAAKQYVGSWVSVSVA